jgi:hypothetical protein
MQRYTFYAKKQALGQQFMQTDNILQVFTAKRHTNPHH